MILTLVRLDVDETDEARSYADTVMRRVVGPNYTHLEQADRFYVGRLGEIAVRKWAERENLLYHETVNDEGVPDEQDFLLHFTDGRLCRANVKNSMHPRASYLMQPMAQADRHEQDVYIGATGEHDGHNAEEAVVRLWGAITRAQFMARAQRVDRKIPTLQFPLAELPYKMEHLAFHTLKKPTRTN